MKSNKNDLFLLKHRNNKLVNYLESNFAKKFLSKGISDELSFEKIFMKNIKLININIISYCRC